MLDIDISALHDSWIDQKKYLKDGLIAGDIWDRSSGLSIADLDLSPEATALFNRLTDELADTLAGSGFPALNRYLLLNLEDDKLFVIVRHGDDLLQGLLLDPKKVNMGILLGVSIPRALQQVQSARS